MKVNILTFLLVLFTLSLLAQVSTYSNYPYNGNMYEVFVVQIDSVTLTRFEIIENGNNLIHKDFLSGNKIDTLSFLINASIVDSQCIPIGFYTNNNQTIQPVNLSDGVGNFYLKPNGALLITDDEAIICESSEIINFNKVRLGIQSGPMLLLNGVVNSHFNPNSKNRNIRCGVGIHTNINNEVSLIFAISRNPISLYEFSIFFKDKFNCYNALTLESVGCILHFPNQAGWDLNENEVICNYIYFKI